MRWSSRDAEAGDGHTDRVPKIRLQHQARYVEMAAKHSALMEELDVSGDVTSRVRWRSEEEGAMAAVSFYSRYYSFGRNPPDASRNPGHGGGRLGSPLDANGNRGLVELARSRDQFRGASAVDLPRGARQ
jgi:hypothetical protein